MKFITICITTCIIFFGQGQQSVAAARGSGQESLVDGRGLAGEVANEPAQVGGGRPRVAAAASPGACRGPNAVILRTTGIVERNRRVLWLERCAEAHWPTIGGIAMLDCIVRRESGSLRDPFAVNPSGSAGLLQIIPSTWSSWFTTMFAERVRMHRLVDDPLNARSNLLLGVWAMQNSLSPWGGGC